MSIVLPNEFHKKAVRDVCTQYRPGSAATDEDFYHYLDDNYQECLAQLDQQTYTAAADVEKTQAVKSALFVFAARLRAYGRIETAGDILRCIPASGHVRRLASAVSALTPVPANLDVLDNTEEVLQWLHNNANRLTWKAQLGRYELL